MILKALFAYHIEALVPSSPHGAHTSQVPQKLSGTKDVHFFSVGTLQNRTLIVYMKKKGVCCRILITFFFSKPFNLKIVGIHLSRTRAR
jgi:hypothetical protein